MKKPKAPTSVVSSRLVQPRCVKRLKSEYPDGSFHVCGLPLGHAGKHKCKRNIGFFHLKHEDCGHRWLNDKDQATDGARDKNQPTKSK